MYREAKAPARRPGAGLGGHRVATRSGPARYKSARGKGGLVRASWDEATELVAAAHVHTIKRYGPDRVAGFSPIPAMSMVSHAAGARFYSLLGGAMLSFYDWYADLPVASPQVFGDQTDVPESGDWWDAGYLIMWGSNLPVTRTPDAHWMAEARYRGQKVIAVSPDYADNVKFADEWLPRPARHRRRAGDGDGPRDPQGVLRRPAGAATSPTTSSATPTCRSWSPSNRHGDALPCRASSSPPPTSDAHRDDARTRRSRPCCSTPPPASRWCRTGRSASASATRAPGSGTSTSATSTRCCRRRRRRARCRRGRAAPLRRARRARPSSLRRGVPVRRVGGHLVTTVFDLLLAQYGVAGHGLPGGWPSGYDDAEPAVHPGLAGGDHRRAGGRRPRGSPASSRANAEESGGRSMIIMGAGTNHWFHSDTIYRSFLDADHADRLPGRQRRRLGALRRAGEGPPDHRLLAARHRLGLVAAGRGR